jgi:hypothetical protein
MARDLAGDLAFHDKATPGLWIAFTSPGGVYEGEVHAHQGSEMDGRLTHVLSTPEGDERDDDIRFAAEAHEGWPAAIRRALWAEAEVERLREMHARACDRIAEQSELLSRRAEREGETFSPNRDREWTERLEEL